jgi:hypothetical protein
LKAFSDANRIEYPMLSDVGSKVIRAFGILNTNIPQDHQMLYGIPFPGNYLLSRDGTVREKHFLPSYEYRASASQVVLRDSESNVGSNAAQIKTDFFDAVITLSTDRCFPGQELAFAIKLELKDGWHVYGKPLPTNYQAVKLEFNGPLVDEQSVELPPAKSTVFPALGETLPVYDGQIRAFGKLGIRWSPPMPAKFLLPLGKTISPGLHKISGSLSFQACKDDLCEPPQTIKFELPLTILSGIPPVPKSSN